MPTSTAFVGLEQHPDPGTLWHRLIGEILQASEHFKQEVSDIHTETEGGRGEKGKTQRSRSAFEDSGALELEQQQQREANPKPSLVGYRQKTRTFLSVQLKQMWCSSGEPNQ